MAKMMKVGIIVLFVVSVVSFLVVLRLFAVKVNEKEKRVQAETQLATVRQEKTKAEEDLGNMTKLKESAESELNLEKERARTLEEEIVAERRAKDELAQNLSEKEKEMERLSTSLEDSKREVNNMTSSIEKLREENKTIQAELAQLRFAKEQLEENMQELVSGGVGLKPVIVKPKAGIEGQVLVVNKEFDFVVTNIGRENMIEQGMILTVLRNNNPIGKIKVEEVYDNMSAAIILPEYKQAGIKEDDHVRYQ